MTITRSVIGVLRYASLFGSPGPGYQTGADGVNGFPGMIGDSITAPPGGR